MNEHIVDYIGEAALLEQTAEEASELSQACLKMARKIRGENPTPKDTNDILENLNEEIADVILCCNELVDARIASDILENLNEEIADVILCCNELVDARIASDILENLNEEIADVILYCNELVDARIASYDDIGGMAMKKYKRWCERVKNEENNRIKQKECLGTSCGNCGGSIDVHDKYCRHCGKKL